MKRAPIVLSVILVFQIALVAFTFWPRAAAGSGSAAPLFGKLSAQDIVALTVYDKPDSSIRLSKQGAGWVLPDAGNFPADGAKVSALLTKLAELKTTRLVSQAANNQPRLKVAANDYLHRIDFQTADGASHTLYVGSSAGARATHIRAGDRNEVYLVEELTAADANAQASAWIDPLYLNVAPADVTAFTLQNANGTFNFSRGGSNGWIMDGLGATEALNKDAVDGLLNEVVPLRMARPLGTDDKPGYGLAQPVARLTLKTNKNNQEKTYTVDVGSDKDAEANYVVKSSESTYYVRAPEYNVKDLIEKKREGFLQAPATPAPAAGPQLPGAAAAPGQ